jgi:hypothetical protein
MVRANSTSGAADIIGQEESDQSVNQTFTSFSETLLLVGSNFVLVVESPRRLCDSESVGEDKAGSWSDDPIVAGTT